MWQSSTHASNLQEHHMQQRDAIAEVQALVSFQAESKAKLDSPWLGCGLFFILFFGGLFCPGICKQASAVQNSVSSVSTITKAAPLLSTSDTIVLYQRSNRLPLQETARLTRKFKPKNLVSVRGFASDAHPVLGPKPKHNFMGGNRADKRLRSRGVRDKKHFLPSNSLPQDEPSATHREGGCNPYPVGTLNHTIFNDISIFNDNVVICTYNFLVFRSKLQKLIDKKDDKPFLNFLANISVEVRAGLFKLAKRSVMDEQLILLQCEDTKKSIEERDTNIARMCADESRAQATEQRAQAAERRLEEMHEIDMEIKKAQLENLKKEIEKKD